MKIVTLKELQTQGKIKFNWAKSKKASQKGGPELDLEECMRYGQVKNEVTRAGGQWLRVNPGTKT